MNHEQLIADIKSNGRHILNNYANFDGRAGLREFWLWFAPLFALCLALQVLGQIAGIFFTLGSLVGLATLIPTLAVGARRLHDTGRSGWMQLLLVIPVIGLLVLAYFWAQPSGK